MIQEAFRPILEELEAGRSAVLHRTVDGVEYTRLFRPRERLILLGGGHIAQPLCRMAAMLDFDVTVVDDRPDFAAASRFPEAGAHRVRRLRRGDRGAQTPGERLCLRHHARPPLGRRLPAADLLRRDAVVSRHDRLAPPRGGADEAAAG